tara:strand:+ start:215 stop:394 length:180 start_codon:yes stop_codon:yes gene_type:complete
MTERKTSDSLVVDSTLAGSEYHPLITVCVAGEPVVMSLKEAGHMWAMDEIQDAKTELIK